MIYLLIVEWICVICMWVCIIKLWQLHFHQHHKCLDNQNERHNSYCNSKENHQVLNTRGLAVKDGDKFSESGSNLDD